MNPQTLTIPFAHADKRSVFRLFDHVEHKYFCQDTMNNGKALIGLEILEEVQLSFKGNQQLQEAKKLQEKYAALSPDFGAVIGIINYEYAHSLENIAPLDDQTVARLVVFKTYLEVDENEIKIFSFENTAPILEVLSNAKIHSSPSEKINPEIEQLIGEETFCQQVEQVLEEIKSGNLFQCVISEDFSVKETLNGLELFNNLYDSEKVPYLYYFKGSDLELVGASPEAFIKIKQEIVTTFPIAGTRPRKQDPNQDAKLAEELKNCPKEKAEHLMLVDLSRNDLGRICTHVKVDQYRNLTSFEKVHHLVSQVSGELRPEVSIPEAFNACFPAGTLTGAPKIQAMKTIHQLEKSTRGPYGGVVFHYHFDGVFDSFIVIRSLIAQGQRKSFRAGAGIVFDSVPAHEYKEIINKSRAIREAL